MRYEVHVIDPEGRLLLKVAQHADPVIGVPEVGRHLGIDFRNRDTRYLGGSWGKDVITGRYTFPVVARHTRQNPPFVVCHAA